LTLVSEKFDIRVLHSERLHNIWTYCYGSLTVHPYMLNAMSRCMLCICYNQIESGVCDWSKILWTKLLQISMHSRMMVICKLICNG